MQELEREKNDMMSHIRELEKLLGANGLEVKPWNLPGIPGASPTYPSFDDDSGKEWTQVGTVLIKKGSKMTLPMSSGEYTRSALLQSRPGEGHLGVASDSAPLSSIKGTTLSVLGTTIDIASFDAPDIDEPPLGTPVGSPLYNKSVMAFLQSTLGVNNPPENCDLPSRHDAFTYSEWYFLMIFPFMPVFHKPSFMKLVIFLTVMTLSLIYH
jgi:hypothetical protein